MVGAGFLCLENICSKRWLGINSSRVHFGLLIILWTVLDAGADAFPCSLCSELCKYLLRCVVAFMRLTLRITNGKHAAISPRFRHATLPLRIDDKQFQRLCNALQSNQISNRVTLCGHGARPHSTNTHKHIAISALPMSDQPTKQSTNLTREQTTQRPRTNA